MIVWCQNSITRTFSFILGVHSTFSRIFKLSLQDHARFRCDSKELLNISKRSCDPKPQDLRRTFVVSGFNHTIVFFIFIRDCSTSVCVIILYIDKIIISLLKLNPKWKFPDNSSATPYENQNASSAFFTVNLFSAPVTRLTWKLTYTLR